ncbi:MAG: hypothetical protein OXI90_16400 [Gammaproteobacteria bacterium]|nr:hypothetical protein [Gammaproteobacteria bacterium]
MPRRNLFTGKAGEHAVISQLLVREWQVAAPEIDVGDDLLVAQDLGRVLRVQVKTCRAKELRKSYAGQFRLSAQQVATPRTPELFFVLVVFHDQDWSDFLPIPRRDLHEEHVLYDVGSRSGDGISLHVSFSEAAVQCSGRDWSRFRDNWSVLSGSTRLERTA